MVVGRSSEWDTVTSIPTCSTSRILCYSNVERQPRTRTSDDIKAKASCTPSTCTQHGFVSIPYGSKDQVKNWYPSSGIEERNSPYGECRPVCLLVLISQLQSRHILINLLDTRTRRFRWSTANQSKQATAAPAATPYANPLRALLGVHSSCR